MSYEEIDRSKYGSDMFTNGAESRYTKPSTKSKRAPKVESSATEKPNNDTQENQRKEDVVKAKKKTRQVTENNEAKNQDAVSQLVPSTDGETTLKPKKARAPKVESTVVENGNELTQENAQQHETVKTKKKTRKTTETNEVSDQKDESQLVPSTEADAVTKPKKSRASKPESTNEVTDLTVGAIDEPVKKKKPKAPKPLVPEDGAQVTDVATINESDTPVKVKKSKKVKTPKVADMSENTNSEAINAESQPYDTHLGIY